MIGKLHLDGYHIFIEKVFIPDSFSLDKKPYLRICIGNQKKFIEGLIPFNVLEVDKKDLIILKMIEDITKELGIGDQQA